MRDKRIAVVIPNYNGLKFMEPRFAALERQTYNEFRVLMVDNGPEDGSMEWLKEHEIPTIHLETNTGFSGAVNVGTRAADTSYVLLFNNDTEVGPKFVGEMVKAISRSQEIFTVSSRMIWMYRRELLDDAGDMYTTLDWAYQRGTGQSTSRYLREREVFSAYTGASIYHRVASEETGYFDEMHFAYLEDIDVSYRVKIHGYHVWYCPTAVVYHVGSGTSGSKYNPFKVKLAARNNIYLNYKNTSTPQLLLNGLPIAAGIGVKYLLFKKLGSERGCMAGILEGLRTYETCKKAPYRPERFRNHLSTQWKLSNGTTMYVCEFLRRQFRKIIIN